MWLTAATELGPGQCVSNIFNDVMKPVGLTVIFTGMYLSDRLRGGYRVERIGDRTVV